MKIIQDNRPLSRFSYPFRLTCASCKGILEVEEGDVKQGTGENQFRAQYNYCFVQCPLCQAENLVTPNKQ